jgi:hypothetical protein
VNEEQFNALVKLIQAVASRAVYEAACRERRLFGHVELDEIQQYQDAKRILVKESER